MILSMSRKGHQLIQQITAGFPNGSRYRQRVAQPELKEHQSTGAVRKLIHFVRRKQNAVPMRPEQLCDFEIGWVNTHLAIHHKDDGVRFRNRRLNLFTDCSR